MDDDQNKNMNKSSAAVKYVEDKIRFVKSGKMEKSNAFKKFENREKLKKGAILRAYKLG